MRPWSPAPHPVDVPGAKLKVSSPVMAAGVHVAPLSDDQSTPLGPAATTAPLIPGMYTTTER